jgi:hypothetical protein
MVNHPPHYRMPNGAQVIDLTENLNFNCGNAVKYLARAGRKPGAETLTDLEKAKWYVNREIARVKEAGEAEADEPADKPSPAARAQAIIGQMVSAVDEITAPKMCGATRDGSLDRCSRVYGHTEYHMVGSKCWDTPPIAVAYEPELVDQLGHAQQKGGGMWRDRFGTCYRYCCHRWEVRFSGRGMWSAAPPSALTDCGPYSKVHP